MIKIIENMKNSNADIFLVVFSSPNKELVDENINKI